MFMFPISNFSISLRVTVSESFSNFVQYTNQLLSIISLIMGASLTTLHPHHNTTHASVERGLQDLISSAPGPFTPRPLSISDIRPPSSAAAAATHTYAIEEHKNTGVYGHLRRSHFFATALLDPALGLFSAETLEQGKAENIAETLWHAIMLHELGWTPKNIGTETPMSFELVGAIQAYEYLNKHTTQELTKWQIDDITEGIVQHTDLLMPGKASLLVQVMHLGIGIDAVGQPMEVLKSLIHEETLRNALREWPREESFRELAAATIVGELKKPGPHMSIL